MDVQKHSNNPAHAKEMRNVVNWLKSTEQHYVKLPVVILNNMWQTGKVGVHVVQDRV